MKLLLATTNEGKIREYLHLLQDSPFEIVTLRELGIAEKPQETGKTFEENAILKAKFYYQRSGIPTLADDGGLEIDALRGEPGVYSRRWPGYEASDEELVHYALERLQGVPPEKRTARFRVVIAIALDSKKISTFTGSLEGKITEKPVYPIIPGYPFRSIFYCPAIGKVLSESSIEEVPNAHRKQALAKAFPFLLRLPTMKEM